MIKKEKKLMFSREQLTKASLKNRIDMYRCNANELEKSTREGDWFKIALAKQYRADAAIVQEALRRKHKYRKLRILQR